MKRSRENNQTTETEKKIRSESITKTDRIEEHQRSVRVTPSPENKQAEAEHIDPTPQQDLRAFSVLSMKSSPMPAEDMHPQTHRSIDASPSNGSFFDLSAMNNALEETLEPETDYSETISTVEEEDYGVGLIID